MAAVARVLIVGGLLAVAAAVYAAVDCALTEPERLRALPRPLWLVVILLLPVVGPLLWFVFGRGTAVVVGRPTGPDDDPVFLRTAAVSRPTARPGTAEPDWQRLEQELVDSDPDGDDDGESRRR